MNRIWVLGVGSPQGDDAVAWQLVERLRSRADLPAEAQAVTPSRLLDLLQPDRDFIIVDACVAEQHPPGTILRWEWPEPGAEPARGSSTHGLGVVDALRLASRLGRLTGRVILFGVVISATAPAAPLGAAVAACLPELERRVGAAIGEVSQTYSGTT